MTDATTQAPKKARPFATAEAKTRHFLLVVGFGFAAFVAGSVLSAALVNRVRERVVAMDSAVFSLIAQILIQRLWLLAVLPVLAYAAARVLELKPVFTAVTAALTGQLFFTALIAVSRGADGVFDGPFDVAVQGGTFVLGVGLTVFAIRQGRAAAAQGDLAAATKAAERKQEYDEMLKASEAIAARHEAAAAPAAAEVVPAEAKQPEPAPKPD